MSFPAGSRRSQERGVKAGLTVVQIWVDDAFHFIDDIPACQCWLVFQSLHHWDQSVVDVAVEFPCILDQTLESPVGASPFCPVPQTQKDKHVVVSGVLQVFCQLVD